MATPTPKFRERRKKQIGKGESFFTGMGGLEISAAEAAGLNKPRPRLSRAKDTNVERYRFVSRRSGKDRRIAKKERRAPAEQ